MSELPEGISRAAPPWPALSALAVVVRRGGAGTWEVLLGKRSRRSRFMPGNLAFPGGRFEDSDGPPDSGGLERCASRELSEETGVVSLAVDSRLRPVPANRLLEEVEALVNDEPAGPAESSAQEGAA